MNAIGWNAQQVIKKRYAWQKIDGNFETWEDIAYRLAKTVSSIENNQAFWFKCFKQIIANRQFIPNTPCIVNAGKPDGQLSACFVLPVEDSINSIMEHAKYCAIIHKSGGGTGMSYEKLRPAGTEISSTRGTASGPVSFMQIVNTVTDVVKQGGVRRGANMGILSINHPDILRFIHAKNDQTSLTNFNISVTVTDDFMQAVEKGEWFQLKFNGKDWDKPIYDPVVDGEYRVFYDGYKLIPFADRISYLNTDSSNLRVVTPPKPGMIYAPDIWNRIIASAHKYAEPGIIFIDEVNRKNLLLNSMGKIIACNPCGEQYLHSYNACNLGSIDVAKFYLDNGKRWPDCFDWENFRNVIKYSVRFLDNVVDINHFPIPQIAETVQKTRPIGLGVMGIADLFLHTKVAYGSDESLKILDSLLSFLRKEAWLASIEIASEKGPFSEFCNDTDNYSEFFKEIGLNTNSIPRNYQVTTIAPTGTISLIAETSSGIEPNFSWAYLRKDTLGERMYAHPIAAKALGIDLDPTDPDSLKQAAKYIQENEHKLPDYFVSAHQITPLEHVEILATAQKHIDNSISKTCNGPSNHTVDDVDKLYKLAKSKGCKCVSYYRDGSRDSQVLVKPQKTTEKIEIKSNGHKTNGLSQNANLKYYQYTYKFKEKELKIKIATSNAKIVKLEIDGYSNKELSALLNNIISDESLIPTAINALAQINGNNFLIQDGNVITSPEKAIANALAKTIKELSPEKNIKIKNYCPECGGEMTKAEGCSICLSCSFSLCK